MYLVEYDNYEIIVTQEALLIKPIRDLYNSDRSKYKEKFMQQMAIMYFCIDPRSSYNYIVEEDERMQVVLEEQGLPSDFVIGKKLAEAMEVYKKHTLTTSSLLIQDTRIAIDKVRTFLREIDLKETDGRGKPIHTLSSITSTIKQIPELSENLMKAERAIAKEITETSRARGGDTHNTIMDNGLED